MAVLDTGGDAVRSVGIAPVRRESRWLVARRREDAHLGGLWEFPGGKCEPGESPEDAAVRELREECGVIASVDRCLACLYFDYGDRKVAISPVLCTWISGDAQPLESQECRWVTLDELRDLTMPAANDQVIRALAEALSGDQQL